MHPVLIIRSILFQQQIIEGNLVIKYKCFKHNHSCSYSLYDQLVSILKHFILRSSKFSLRLITPFLKGKPSFNSMSGTWLDQELSPYIDSVLNLHILYDLLGLSSKLFLNRTQALQLLTFPPPPSTLCFTRSQFLFIKPSTLYILSTTTTLWGLLILGVDIKRYLLRTLQVILVGNIFGGVGERIFSSNLRKTLRLLLALMSTLCCYSEQSFYEMFLDFASFILFFRFFDWRNTDQTCSQNISRKLSSKDCFTYRNNYLKKISLSTLSSYFLALMKLSKVGVFWDGYLWGRGFRGFIIFSILEYSKTIISVLLVVFGDESIGVICV